MYFHTGTFQPGRLSGPMRAELERGLGRPGQPAVYRVVELDLPSGTRRYSSTAIPWPGGGYEARVLAWGTVGWGADLRSDTLSAAETSIEIQDVDRDFATEVQRYRGSMRGSAVRIRLISPNVSDADAYQALTGILKGYEMSAPFRWRLSFGPADDELQNGYVPDVPVARALFPNAHDDALGLYLPVVYGVHSSQGTTGKGFVSLPCVDTVAFVYIVGLGVVTVQSVFKDGTLVAASGYTVTYPVYGGRRYTAVVFPATQADASITADVQGLTDNPAGGGTLISNDAAILRHMLANLVFNHWDGRSAYFPPGDSPIDLETFRITEDFCGAHPGYEGSRWIGGDQQTAALELVNEWASGRFKVFWTERGKLAVLPLDYRPIADPYATDQWVRATEDDDGSFRTPYDSTGLVSKVALQYLYGETAGKYFYEQLVSSLAAGVDVTESRQARWSKAAVS